MRINLPSNLLRGDIGNCCGTTCIYGFYQSENVILNNRELIFEFYFKNILRIIENYHSGGYFTIIFNQDQTALIPLIASIGFKQISEFRNFNSVRSCNPIIIFELILNSAEDNNIDYRDKYPKSYFNEEYEDEEYEDEEEDEYEDEEYEDAI